MTLPKSRSNHESQMLAANLGFTRWSYILLSTFLVTLFILGYVWWPLAEEYLGQIDWNRPIWQQIDWLLIGIFVVMTILIMSGADLKVDILIVGVGLVGGLVIESWGTQTELWTYYTRERPPLWIIPAWPIASLSIDRLVRILHRIIPKKDQSLQKIDSTNLGQFFRISYWALFPSYLIVMLYFVRPTLDKSFTWIALIICILMILTPTNHRLAILTFLAGTSLGYFLERWGTTRLCWTYYTGQTPPFFAVLAHGMAAVAFWRVGIIALDVWQTIMNHTHLNPKKSVLEGKD